MVTRVSYLPFQTSVVPLYIEFAVLNTEHENNWKLETSTDNMAARLRAV